jgi:hypothetical protein
MNKNIIWALVIKNSVVTICWTTLAIVFNKWWIALFGILFISFISTQGKGTYRICDKCGKHSPYAKNYAEALDMAKAAGWIHYNEGDKDYCPDCRKELNK